MNYLSLTVLKTRRFHLPGIRCACSCSADGLGTSEQRTTAAMEGALQQGRRKATVSFLVVVLWKGCHFVPTLTADIPEMERRIAEAVASFAGDILIKAWERNGTSVWHGAGTRREPAGLIGYLQRGSADLYLTATLVIPDSSVGLATPYRLNGLGIESRWGARFSAHVQTGPGDCRAFYSIRIGSFSEPRLGVDHPPPSGGEVQEWVQIYLYTPPFRNSWHVLGWTLTVLIATIMKASFKLSKVLKVFHFFRISPCLVVTNKANSFWSLKVLILIVTVYSGI